ncbi:hypothetical protein G7072_07035 [Nocardioides sp. HDW12B]|uniref:hypothetical protein n=1 Tax=Nocardioides sp. HDW12B TaxID=2714939 RepID=UPI0014095EF0|nr:hypothetical protein [Nocardioides sp. HDW12B]QIK66130.1 hypothetical protein G7072_07035 [Nocardioides sp. HDW12B]
MTSSTKENALTPIRLAQSLAHTAVHTAVDTVRHPVAGASRAVGLARGAIQVARAAPGIVADTVATRTQGGPPTDGPVTSPADRPADRAADRAADSPRARAGAGTSKPADSSAPAPGPLKTTVPDPANPTAPPAPGQGGVPDLAPPDPADRVLVVEEALAAEAADGTTDSRFGVATEPHASTRGEDHGERPLARAEVDELAEEAEARE